MSLSDKAISWWNGLSYSETERIANDLFQRFGAESGVGHCDERFSSISSGGNPVEEFLSSDSISAARILVLFKRVRGLP